MRVRTFPHIVRVEYASAISSRARSIFAVFKMRERLDVKSAKSNTIATTTIRRSVRRGVIPIRVIFTLFLTLFVVFVILPVTLGRGFSVADSARCVLRGFALLRRRVGLLRRLRGRVFLQTCGIYDALESRRG